jgi:hypothetical protein
MKSIRERNRRRCFEVLSSCRPPAAAPTTEEVSEDVIQRWTRGALTAKEITEIETLASAPRSTTKAAANAGGSDLVVLRPAGRITEYRVRLGDLLESLLGVGIPLVLVGVVLHRELAISLLDGVSVGTLGHPKSGVVVLLQEILHRHANNRLLLS